MILSKSTCIATLHNITEEYSHWEAVIQLGKGSKPGSKERGSKLHDFTLGKYLVPSLAMSTERGHADDGLPGVS
ncbi:hypothetical protein SK128_027360 [Halocaridina rubra]|uniref:Uncharacterized protein n=1 Tax=Halocaridina rubra TaxID=373956 RepID=A0AAN8XDA5_HALRR